MQGSSLRTGENVAEIRVNLVDKQHRSESSIMLVRELRTKVDAIRARYPGAQVRLVEDPPGPPVRARVLPELHGEDRVGLRRLVKQVEPGFRSEGVRLGKKCVGRVNFRGWRIVKKKKKKKNKNNY